MTLGILFVALWFAIVAAYLIRQFVVGALVPSDESLPGVSAIDGAALAAVPVPVAVDLPARGTMAAGVATVLQPVRLPTR